MDKQGKRSTDKKDTLKVHREELEITKETVETGTVKIHKSVNTESVVTRVPLLREEVSITRVPINKEVAETPEVRREGEVTIVSVMKEVPVVTTKLILVEEIHISKESHEHIEKIDSILRSEHVEIERKGPE